MTEESNKVSVRRYFDEVWVRGSGECQFSDRQLGRKAFRAPPPCPSKKAPERFGRWEKRTRPEGLQGLPGHLRRGHHRLWTMRHAVGRAHASKACKQARPTCSRLQRPEPSSDILPCRQDDLPVWFVDRKRQG
jgi:hypothetical protein